MVFGPYLGTQALYYTAYNNNQVRRIVHTASSNVPPTAVASANPTYGSLPLNVTFSAAGSNDPDGGSLSFNWNFGDGITTTTTSTTTMHSYAVMGVYTATLTASDGISNSVPATVQVFAGDENAPVPTITAPLSSTTFYVGQPITLTGSATDADEGALQDSRLSWTVLLWHVDEANPGNAHSHGILPPTTGNNVPFTAPAPEGFSATALSYVEIRLTAADSFGLTTTITQTLQPNRVNMTFVTVPGGRQIVANNLTYTATATLISWQSYLVNVSVPLQKDSSNNWWRFESWSDAAGNPRTIATQSTPITYTTTLIPALQMWLPIILRQ
jgi:PKD repeat protein